MKRIFRKPTMPHFPVTDPAATIVSAGHPGLADTVLTAGRVVKRDGVLVDIDLAALRTRLLASRNRIAAAAGIPLDSTWRPQPETESMPVFEPMRCHDVRSSSRLGCTDDTVGRNESETAVAFGPVRCVGRRPLCRDRMQRAIGGGIRPGRVGQCPFLLVDGT